MKLYSFDVPDASGYIVAERRKAAKRYLAGYYGVSKKDIEVVRRATLHSPEGDGPTLLLPFVAFPTDPATYRHKKRQSCYRVFGTARLQTEQPLGDDAELTLYRDIDSGAWAVRPPSEFVDGRFEDASS